MEAIFSPKLVAMIGASDNQGKLGFHINVFGLIGVLITHRLPLSEALRGYEIFDKRLEECLKVLLKP